MIGPSKEENITNVVFGADSNKVGPIRVNNTEVTRKSSGGSNVTMISVSLLLFISYRNQRASWCCNDCNWSLASV